MMEVKEFQRQIADYVSKWDRKRNAKPSEEDVFIHLVEEIGELAQQYVNKHSRKDRYSKEELENAICDILMQTVKLANMTRIDVEEAVLKVIEEESKLLK